MSELQGVTVLELYMYIMCKATMCRSARPNDANKDVTPNIVYVERSLRPFTPIQSHIQK